MRKVIITSILSGFHHKNHFFDGYSLFNFNRLRVALGIALKFYTSVEKNVETKSQKVLDANSYVCRSYRGKTGSGGGGAFCPHPESWVGLMSVL